jgi:predicted ATPase
MQPVHEFRDALIKCQKYGRWLKVDLHNHSPASFDYIGHVPTAAQDSARRIDDSELSIVMFTDHGRLPDKGFVYEVSKRSRALILRGVELNVFADAFDKPSGKIDREAFFHLLVGFDPDHQYDADFWLQTIYKDCGQEERIVGGNKIVGIPCEIDRVLESIRTSNALLIPAHLHSNKDAFRSRSIDDIYADPRFLSFLPKFDAIEVTDKKTAQFFDGKHPETRNAEISCIQSSDAHEPQALGSRPTWMLMQEPNFSELRAALGMRARTSLVQPQLPDSYVVGMHVEGSYLRDLWLAFSPHCNVFIGVKGSGKTAALECLRFVLGVEVPRTSREQVKGHLQHILGSTGKVRCLLRRADGSDVLVERRMSDPDSFQVWFEDGRSETFSQIRALGFPAQILGWHEIEHAATDSTVRRKYLDGIAGPEEISKLEAQIRLDAEQVKYQHEQAASRYHTFRLLNDQVTSKEEIRRGLQELQDAKLLELRDAYDAAIAHRDEMRRLAQLVAPAKQGLSDRARELLPFAEPILPGMSPLDLPVSEMRGSFSDLLDRVRQFSVELAEALNTKEAQLGALLVKADEAFAAFSKSYEAEVGELPEDKRRLLESHRQVMEQTRDLTTLQAQRDEAMNAVRAQLQGLIQLCEKIASGMTSRSDLRRDRVAEFAQSMLSPDLRLTLRPAQSPEDFADYSAKYKDGYSVLREIQATYSTETTLHARLKRAYERLLHDLVHGYRLFFTQAEFTHFLTALEDDDLLIEFDPLGSGSGHKPIDQLSAGQRCTAMFPLLLRLKQGPLVLDQPEDNLDNRHIATKVSPSIATDKAGRQIVMTSHNANLLVLSDPESVVVFEGYGDYGAVVEQGFLATRQSPVTQHVLDILDGGERALELRYAKYGKGAASGK